MVCQDSQSGSEPGGNNDSIVTENSSTEKNDIERGVGTDNNNSRDEAIDAGSKAKEEVSVSKKTTQMQSLEIDVANAGHTDQNCEESFEKDEDDRERLLGGECKTDKNQSTSQQQLICFCCEKPEKVGNMTVFLPSRCAKTGWGIAGPHWFGPLCVLLLVGFASHYFIQISARRVGFITEATCVLFTLACAYNLGK